VGDWYGWYGEPVSYDYGTGIVYEDGNVVSDGQVIATEEQYYDQASAIADQGQTVADDTQWMPLGVFALVEKETDPQTDLFQLSVSKDGAIGGSYARTDAPDKTSAIKGSVDKKTQRVAWTIDSWPGTVYEAGIFNLTQDKAPLLVHADKDKTLQKLLVRVSPPSSAGQQPASSPAQQPATPTTQQ
jgi:hypothetical protein